MKEQLTENTALLSRQPLPKKGKLAVFKGPGQAFEIVDADTRLIEPGEVLVKNLYTTICGSDLHTYCGKRKEACPTVLGHEIVGEIVQVGVAHSGLDHIGHPLRQGTLVTWSVFSSDPQSYYSLQGIPQKGEGLYKYGHALLTEDDAFHGGLAEYCVLKPGTCIVALPDGLPLPVAATINCAIATVAGSIRLAGDLKGKNVMIFGMGLLGLTCAAMCREAGAAWVGAADISADRLQDVLAFGASEAVLLTPDGQAIKAVQHKFPRNGVDLVFDMSGSPSAMEAGLDMLAIGGTAVWVGAVFNTRRLHVDAEKIIRRLLTIKGLHNYNYEDLVSALDFMAAHWKTFPFENVVEKEFSLFQANEAFEYALQNKPLRVGVRI
jgi:putative phosphonate catabolism associated alcohol dehydrogenase